MRVIRKIDNNLIIKTYGYCEAGGLGEFDPLIYEEVELEELPDDYTIEEMAKTAQGKDLIQYIENAFIGQSLETRIGLQTLFTVTGIKGILESTTCNPLSNSDFTEIVALVNNMQELDTQQKATFTTLATQWQETVVFQV